MTATMNASTMSFELSEDHKMVKDMVKKLADEEILPRAAHF